ncbi:unnamed protein product, partial [Didymodactylos carnosus]
MSTETLRILLDNNLLNPQTMLSDLRDKYQNFIRNSDTKSNHLNQHDNEWTPTTVFETNSINPLIEMINESKNLTILPLSNEKMYTIEFYCDNRLPVFNEWQNENAFKFYRTTWSNGIPILVKNIHCNLNLTLYEPNKLKEYMLEQIHLFKKNKRKTENIMFYDSNDHIQILCDSEQKIEEFWNGFMNINETITMRNRNGQKRPLKTIDWPSTSAFRENFPTWYQDFMKNIPFPQYTADGCFNLVQYLSKEDLKPDLGPKFYIDYENSDVELKCGTANLHIDSSDSVNVLVYVNNDSRNNNDNIEQLIRSTVTDVKQLERIKYDTAGAIWNIFRASDVPLIEEYIRK